MNRVWKMSSMPNREVMRSTPSKSAKMPAKAAITLDPVSWRARFIMSSTVAVPKRAAMIRQPRAVYPNISSP